MRITLLLLFLTITILGYSQKTTEEKINDPKLGEITLVKEYDKDGELYNEQKIKEKFNDPKLGEVTLVIEYLDGELYSERKIKRYTYNDPKLGEVKSLKEYNEEGILSYEKKEYGITQSERYYTFKGKSGHETKKFKDKNGNEIKVITYFHVRKNIPREIQRYSNDKKDGKQTYYHNNGEIHSEKNYVKGVKVGIQKVYYDNKQLHEEENYDTNGELDGDCKYYNRFGDLEKKGTYKQGKKAGTWEYYDTTINKLTKRCVYKETHIDCEEREYYTLDTHDNTVSAKKIWHTREEDEGRYSNNHGSFKIFFPNKEIKEEGEYNKGKKHGIWKLYDESGHVLSEIKYDNDSIKHYSFQQYNGDGIIYRQGSFTDESRKNGLLKTYTTKGQLKSEKTYEKGEVITDLEFDEKQRIIFKKEFSKDTVHLEIHRYDERIVDKGYAIENDTLKLYRKITHENGKLKEEGLVFFDLKSEKFRGFENSPLYKIGRWKAYYENGTLQWDGEFLKNVQVGEWHTYYENGNIGLKGMYLLDDNVDFLRQRKSKKNGEWTSYTEDGAIQQKINYKKGVENGIAETYFNNKQLHRRVRYDNGKLIEVLSFYNQQGEKINHGTFADGNGTLKLYDLKTGVLTKTVNFEDGGIKMD